MNTAEQLAGLILDADLPKRLQSRLDHVERAARQILNNWDEFGPEGGIDEYMDGLRKVLNEGGA